MRRTIISGFTLVEVSIVLIVVGVLTTALTAPLETFLRERRIEATHAQLVQIRQALIGHLMTEGHLPCPVSDAASLLVGRSVSTSTAGSPCSRSDGLLPGAVLGAFGRLSEAGALLDIWGRPLRYGVSLASSRQRGDPRLPDWTTIGEPEAVGLAELSADLVLCRSPSTGRCPDNRLQTDSIAFVVYSTGADASDRDTQRENLDGDSSYVIAPRSSVDGFRFDDLFVWASRNELAYWLVRANVLP